MSDDGRDDPMPGRCGAPTKRGGICNQRRTKPVEIEGEWVVPTRCKYHGGTRQAMPIGDPGRGGALVTTGLGLRIGERVTARARVAEAASKIEAYGRHLTDSEMLAAYVSPEFRLGTLDADLKLARSYLVDAVRNHQANPRGGVVSQRGNVVKIRLHKDVVADWLEIVGRLEGQRAKLARSAEPGDDDLMGHEAWVKATKSRGGQSRSPSARRSSSRSSSGASSASSSDEQPHESVK